MDFSATLPLSHLDAVLRHVSSDRKAVILQHVTTLFLEGALSYSAN